LDSLLVEEENESGKPWMLDAVLESLERKIVQHEPELVVIDSFYSHAPTGTDTNKHTDVAPTLVKLRKLADRHECAIVLIHHTNKSQSNDPVARIAGSTGIVATARHVLMVGTHPENGDVRVIAIAKSNLTKPNTTSHQFKLDPFDWIGETTIAASELFETNSGEVGETNQTRVEIFLREALADGPVDAARIIQQGEISHGINKRTLQRAANRLDVLKRFQGFGPKRQVFWSLPLEIDDSINDISDTLA